MEVIAILLLIFLPLGLVIWLIARTIISRQAIAELRLRQQRLEIELSLVKRQLESRAASVPAAPEAEIPSEPTVAWASEEPTAPAEPPPIVPASATVPVPPPLPAAAFASAAAPPPLAQLVPARGAGVLTAPEIGPAMVPEVRSKETAPLLLAGANWEQFVGVKLFAWLGGLALFLAAAFGLKYSFEHDLIPPVLRATLGFVLGGGLVGGGVWLRRREYAVTSQTLCAVGTVILYAVTFACHSLYHFAAFSLPVTFGLMAVISVGAFTLAVRLDAQVVAVLGVLGGFLTPVLLSTGEDNPGGLFGYLALLDGGLIGIARRRRWDYLVLLGAIGTVVMQLAWLAKFFAPEKFFIAEAVLLGFSALFLAAFAWAQRRDWFNAFILAAAITLPAVALMVSFDLVTDSVLKLQPGRVFSLVFGADLCLLAMVIVRPQVRVFEVVAGALSFLLLSTWTIHGLDAALLPWALGLYLGFALLHTVFPVVMSRLRPGVATPVWCQFFPGVALVLTVLPLVQNLTLPWSFWPVVLMIDLLAVGMALQARSLLALLATLALTLVTTGVWMNRFPPTSDSLPEALLVIGGFGVFFVAAMVFALWRLAACESEGAGRSTGVGSLEALLARPGPEQVVPGLPAILPFLLLTSLALQLRPANPSAIFGVALVLLALLGALVWWTRLGALLAAGLACAALLEASWLTSSFTPEHAAIPFAWFAGFYGLFMVFPFLGFRRFESHRTVWITAALSGPLHFLLIHRLVKLAWPNDAMGLVPAAFAVPSFAALLWLERRLADTSPRRLHHLAWFGGVTLLFVTLVFPVQFDKEWLTIGWALEGVALLWLFHRVAHPGLRLAGTGLLVIAFVRLALNPTVLGYHPRSATPVLNWYLYTYGIATVALFAGARLLAPPHERVLGSNARAILTTLGTILAFALVNVEVADYFATGPTLTFEFTGNIARDMTYTIAWALFAFMLVALGILRELRPVRYAGIGLLGVTLVKLFLHDLARLNQLYRIGAFVAVAVIAILASVLYQRFLARENRPAA